MNGSFRKAFLIVTMTAAAFFGSVAFVTGWPW